MKITIGLKMGGCFLLTLIVLILSSLYSLSGVNKIRTSLEHIAGDAWQSSENSSLLSLNVNQSTNLLQNSLLYAEPIPKLVLDKMDLHLSSSFASLEHLKQSDYAAESLALNAMMNQLKNLKEQVVKQHGSYIQAIKETNENVVAFNKLMKRLGFYANYQVSSLEDAFQRDQVNSWSGDVEDKWEFVIAIYSSQVALGDSVVALQKQLQSSHPHNETENVLQVLEDLSGNMSEIIGSQLAIQGTINSGVWKDKNYSEASKAILQQHIQGTKNIQKLQREFIATRDQLIELSHALEKHTMSLSGLIASQVQEETSVTVDNANFLNKTMASSLPIGVLLTLLAIWLSYRMVITPVKNASAQMADIASGEGDLRVRLPVKGNDEIAELAGNFNKFVSKTSEAVSLVSENAQSLVCTSETLKSNSTSTQVAVETQNAECEQAVTAMCEINTTVNDIASNASEAAKCSEGVKLSACQGREKVEQNRLATEGLSLEIEAATKVIANLAEESNKVGSIISVIQGIAEQTNLLALNAAIEAARAGDHGRGFAVVADEVRALSHSTQQATEEIKGLLDALQSKANQAVTVMEGGQELAADNVKLSEQVQQLISRVSEEVDQINQLNLLIATATEEQAHVTSLTRDNLERIGSAAMETAESSKSNSDISIRLENQASQLKDILSQFRV
ncbi:methyl-accepting chemotaxis protein [Neptuniibacter sp.]|uniref:methyl-accepting chemotaxis protein n=1 Tax=Neptuniibacter sp. TaxID=1962643 RepID=UPI00261AEFD1|nr:methyl-accepting chemotaxis protein [Neptuniibacter sp.]MCP4597617.1 methyl-accepting chemotaxis protein [Neptuniibacter sp.]